MAFKPIFWYTQRIFAFIYWLLAKFWYRFEVIGRPHLQDLTGPLIIISNHKSRAEHFFIGAGFPKFWLSPLLPIQIMAKDNLFENFLSNMFFRAIGTYPACYGQGIEVSLQKPLQILKSNEVVGMYPEGRRVYEDKVGEFKKGVAELVSRSPETPILPVIVHGSGDLWGELIPRFRQTVRVAYGKPVKVDANKTVDEITMELRQALVLLHKNTQIQNKQNATDKIYLSINN